MRKYNRKKYNIVKRLFNCIRQILKSLFFSNATKSKTLNKIGKNVSDITIEKPIRKTSYFMTSFFYNPKEDHPIKGTIIYTIFYILIFGIVIAILKSFFK